MKSHALPSQSALLSIVAFLAVAFFAALPAHAYVYNNPVTATGATTIANTRCTGAVVSSLGSNTGSGAGPAWATLAWSYLNGSSLPANYSNGSYCIDALLTVTSGGGGGGGGGSEVDNSNHGIRSFLALITPHALALNGSTWEVDYTLHSGSGTTAAANYYALTYAAATAPTASLSSAPSSITSGSSSVLTWSSSNATSCTGTGFSTANAVSGSVSVSPTVTTTYSVSCSGAGGSASQSTTVTVTAATAPPSITSFTVTPSPVGVGGTVTISWASSNAAYCSSAQFDTQGATSGTATAVQSVSTTYTLTCTGAPGTGTGTWQYRNSDTTDLSCPWTDPNRPYPLMPTCSATSGPCTNPPDKNCKVNSGVCSAVNTDIYTCIVSTPPPSVSQSVTVPVSLSAPTATLSFSPSTVTSGQSSTLSWSSTNAVDCAGNGFATGGATSGSVVISTTTTSTYSITCSAAAGGTVGNGWTGDSWWSNGTVTNVFWETMSDGLLGDICANEAATAGYSQWNETITRHPNQCGDAGCDLLTVKCDGVSGATQTVDKPYKTGGIDAGYYETHYFRSSDAPVSGGGIATAQATLTVTPGLTASCSAAPSTTGTGQTVFWTATASGGTPSASNAWVTIGYSAAKCVSQTCPWQAGIGGPPADNTCSTVGQSCTDCQSGLGQFDTINYQCQAGSSAPVYTYSWSGTDGLTGSGSTIGKAYATTGTKNATVTVTSGSSPAPTGAQWASGSNGTGTSVFGPGSEGGLMNPNDVAATCAGYCSGYTACNFSYYDNNVTIPSSTVFQCLGVNNPSGTVSKPADTVRLQPGNVPATRQYGTQSGSSGSASVNASCSMNIAPACSDGIDNNGNGAIDCADAGCHTDGNAGNAASCVPNQPTEDPQGVTGCTVDNATPPLNQQVTYTVAGGTAPYTWTASSPSSCTASTGSTKTCTFTTAGPYTMSVAGASGVPVSCSLVTAAIPALTLTATPSRVTLINGSAPTVVTWSATNVSSCSMTRNGAVYTPQAPATLIPNSSGVLSSPSANDTVTGQTVYRLTCNGTTATAIVNVSGGQTEF